MVVNFNCFPLVVVSEYRTGCSNVREHNLPRIHIVHDSLNEGGGNKLFSLRRDGHLQDAVVNKHVSTGVRKCTQRED